MIFTTASHTAKTRLHDTYIYVILIYVRIGNFDLDLRLLTLRNYTGFSHEHVHEHVIRFNCTWLILYNYKRNICSVFAG